MTTISTTPDKTIEMPINGAATRYWEIDFSRGIAIILVELYHFVWGLSYFGLYPVNILSTPWQIFARSIGSTFIFLSGLSLTLSYSREVQRLGSAPPPKKYLWYCTRLSILTGKQMG